MTTTPLSTSNSTSGIAPFTIHVSDEQIEFLKQKLSLTVLPDELESAGWDYGVPLADLKRLLARWKDGYDWRVYEKQLNDELSHFQTDIEVEGFGTLKIHYIHQESEVVDAIPLLFVHGWPGSFIEVKKILPLLLEESVDHPSFHVVTYSLPGYGFSEGPTKKGFGITQYAEVGHKLMLKLGYDKYVTQGGDWGYRITRRIANLYGGRHSMAWHSNLVFPIPGQWPPTLLGSPFVYLTSLLKGLTPAEKAGLERTAWFTQRGEGYYEEQSTQPQTIGYSFADSPAGLLAWIYEKLVNWTDNYPWEDDEVLTWVSIYWFSTAGSAASARIYYEYAQEKPDVFPTIPYGASFFPKELINLPRLWTKTKYRIFESEHERGGHFAAYERPDELVDDLRKMFGKGGPAYGVVNGKTGY